VRKQGRKKKKGDTGLQVDTFFRRKGGGEKLGGNLNPREEKRGWKDAFVSSTEKKKPRVGPTAKTSLTTEFFTKKKGKR